MSFRLRFAAAFLAAILVHGSMCPRAHAGNSDIRSEGSGELRYDEQMALGMLAANVDQLRAAMKRTGTDRDHPGGTDWQNEKAVVDIGWIVVALGEFSNGNDAVKKALFQIKSEFGFLALPYWLGWDDRRMNIARFYSFSSGNGIITLDLPRQELLYSLATQAEKLITKRSGYKFEGYDGPALSRVD